MQKINRKLSGLKHMASEAMSREFGGRGGDTAVTLLLASETAYRLLC